jgi:RNA polymerase-binding transcription factor DksA
MPDTAAAKARLEAQLAELEARQSRIAEDLASRSIPTAANRRLRWRMMPRSRRRERWSRGRSPRSSALARIADGNYGECVRCGEEIAAARLEALA